MAYQSPSFWQPSVMSSAPVNYPALPFPNGQSTQRPTSSLNSAIANQRNRAANAGGVSGGANMMGGPGAFNDPTGATFFKTYNMPAPSGMGGGMAGGGGGQFGGAGNLANWYQDALNRSNQANEARYRDALGGYQSRYERGMGMLSGLGQQEGRDINQLYDSQAASQRQSLVGRGLGNSTVLDTMLMGNERERNADLGRLNDRVRQQALSQDSNLSGDVLQFMERKTDKPPDIGLLAQLYQGMGQGGYGMGGFGGGYGGGGYGQPDYSGGFNPYMFQQYPNYYGGSSPQNQARLGQAAQYYMNRNAARNSPTPYNYSPSPDTSTRPTLGDPFATPDPSLMMGSGAYYDSGYDPRFVG